MSLRRIGSASVERHSNRSIVRKRLSSANKRLSIPKEESSEEVARGIILEIVENADKKINEIYMEAQTIKFVVHCAHEALKNFLRIHFYQHNDYAYSPEFWGPGIRPPPSFPDSWALNQIPFYKEFVDDQTLNTLSRIKMDMEAQGEEVELDATLEEAIEPSESLLVDISDLLDDIIENLPLSEDATTRSVESESSLFTKLTTGEKDYKDFKVKTHRSRITTGTSVLFRLPRLDVQESGYSRIQRVSSEVALAEKLPPIRTDAKYKCRRSTSTVPPTEKLKKPKKP